MAGFVHSDYAVIAAPMAVHGDYWTSIELLIRIGIPLLLIAIGAGLVIWGRREHAEAQHQIHLRSDFPLVPSGGVGRQDRGPSAAGSYPGYDQRPTVDEYDGSDPDPDAGRAKIAGGYAAFATGLVALIVITSIRVFSG